MAVGGKNTGSGPSAAAFWMALFTLGVLALAAGTLLDIDRVSGLSPDGALSFSFQERLNTLRCWALLAGALLATLGLWRWLGRLIGLISLFVCLAWVGVMLNRLYPGQILSRPDRLLQAALGQEILLSDYQPKTYLTVPVSEVLKAKFPVINVHAHFRRSTPRTPEQMDAIMGVCNVRTAIDMDGGLGQDLRDEVERFVKPYPGRFLIMANVWFGQQLSDWNYFAKDVEKLTQAKADGAVGIKIWKNLGLWTRDENKKLLTIDDPRVDLLWTQAGKLKLPVLIHIADLPSNFDPLDRFNDRFEFLKKNLDLAYQGPKAPSPLELLAQFERVVSKHPEVTFILAHTCNRTDNLEEAGKLLDRHPNLYTDISARANELGRQPSTARAFFIKYADRLLFGTDGNPDEVIYRGYFRLLETDDDFFNDPRWPRLESGRWKLYGLKLPDDVLCKVYHDNAARLFGLKTLQEMEAAP